MTSAVALLLIPLLVFSGALLPVLFRARTRAVIAVSAAVGPAAATVMLYMLGLDVTSGAVPSVHLPWLPALGLHISFRLDGWALLFSGLVLGIGLLVILYAHYYLGQSDPAGRFFATLLAFMGAMLGIALSDNLLLLVLFWELTSLASFLLVGYWSDRSDARSGARMALTVTGAGGLCLLGGALMLSEIAGTAQISSINGMGDAIRAHPRYGIALCMILLGAFTKSAQFPFHFWLPNAMAAPTPVSAYLHSATMVKAGIFLLARLHPALSGSDLWFYAVGGTGLATLVFVAGGFSPPNPKKSSHIHTQARPRGHCCFLFQLSKRGTARFASGEEALVDGLAREASEGAAMLLKVTRAATAEKGRYKLAHARPTDEALRPAPHLVQALGGRVVRQLPSGLWEEIFADAWTGQIETAGCSLLLSPTPAMTLIDIDGSMPPFQLALAAVPALARALACLDLAGSIGIDFPTLTEKAQRRAVDDALSAALAHWPHERTAMNGFGFVQLVARLEHPSLVALVQQDRAGAFARLLLRQAEQVREPGVLLLTACDEVRQAIRPEWEAELRKRTGRDLRWNEESPLLIDAIAAQAVAP